MHRSKLEANNLLNEFIEHQGFFVSLRTSRRGGTTKLMAVSSMPTRGEGRGFVPTRSNPQTTK